VIRSIFLGTPPAAIPALGVIQHATDLRLIVTQPDRPRGRSGTPRPSAVKEEALRLSVPVLQPGSRQELVAGIGEVRPFDVGVLVAFGMIVPASALRLADKGFLNLHFSLLPRWRGAAPIQHAILAGDGSTGVTIIEIDVGLDTGPVLASSVQEIDREDTSGTLEQKLASRGARLLGDLLPDYVEGRARPRAQDDAQATYAPKIEPAETGLDFREPAAVLARRVRAFNPRPGAFVLYEGQRIKVWEADDWPERGLAPGRSALDGSVLMAGTGQGSLRLISVQAANRRRMSGVEWARGRLPLGTFH